MIMHTHTHTNTPKVRKPWRRFWRICWAETLILSPDVPIGTSPPPPSTLPSPPSRDDGGQEEARLCRSPAPLPALASRVSSPPEPHGAWSCICIYVCICVCVCVCVCGSKFGVKSAVSMNTRPIHIHTYTQIWIEVSRQHQHTPHILTKACRYLILLRTFMPPPPLHRQTHPLWHTYLSLPLSASASLLHFTSAAAPRRGFWRESPYPRPTDLSCCAHGTVRWAPFIWRRHREGKLVVIGCLGVCVCQCHVRNFLQCS
jgi:hypothetical protein